jgi:hypothetical protein
MNEVFLGFIGTGVTKITTTLATSLSNTLNISANATS